MLPNTSTDEKVGVKPNFGVRQGPSSRDLLIEPVEVKYQCEDCFTNKKDLVLLPCNHFEFCSSCIFRDSQFGVNHLCLTCNTVASRD